MVCVNMALVLSCSEIVIADCKDNPDNKSFVESYFKILMRMVMKILTILVMFQMGWTLSLVDW